MPNAGRDSLTEPSDTRTAESRVPGIEEQSGGQRFFQGQAVGVGTFSRRPEDILAFQRALQQQSCVPAQDILQIGGEGRRSIGTRAKPVQGRKRQIAAQ